MNTARACCYLKKPVQIVYRPAITAFIAVNLPILQRGKMFGEMAGRPAGPGVGGYGQGLQEVKEAFQVEVQNLLFCSIVIQCAAKACDARRRFARPGNRRIDECDLLHLFQ